MATIKIKIYDVVGGGEFVDTSDGHKVHDLVAKAIESGDVADLSFQGGTQIITAFTNAAIGQLYNEFSEDEIRRHLRLTDLPDGFSDTLVKSINRAKRYFANKDDADSIEENE
ncbi:hypothetical protein H261_21226 [Paramagnetospirillum caucaseum]|uniref:DUF4325 domain-containing protein n=1 Tax=Paramagnetospirillum caucaseum TaxID=1244869 RepID=M3A4V8_9PROT|nr:STAS-like domain-containing protein [Paramagnetospirillum caucaseum]EME67883.1 hypothetical protein H261_21226 [Paramagnetospirillum caucaseum]